MDASAAEIVACNLCESKHGTLLFADDRLSPDGTMGVVRCNDCGFVYRNIREWSPRALVSYRDRRYEEPSGDWIEGRVKAFRPYAETLELHRGSGRILDVGAGYGFFLRMCAEHGWEECHGVEPSEQCRAFALEHFGLRYEHATLDEASYPEAYFDVVTFWNVLDQLSDPKAALRAACRYLTPGGVVLVRSPNAGFHVPVRTTLRALSRLHAGFGRLDQTVLHLHAFDRRSISNALRASGFEDPRVSPAELGWTTTHGAGGRPAKHLILGGVAALAGGVSALTARRVLLAPSFLAIARKSS